MIAGIGTDILKISSLNPDYLKPDDPFVRRTFTENEIHAAWSGDHTLSYLADRFAGKESVFKALGTDGEHARLNEIEILNDEKQIPYVLLHGTLLEEACRKGITKIHISLSFDKEYAVAFAVAETNE